MYCVVSCSTPTVTQHELSCHPIYAQMNMVSLFLNVHLPFLFHCYKYVFFKSFNLTSKHKLSPHITFDKFQLQAKRKSQMKIWQAFCNFAIAGKRFPSQLCHTYLKTTDDLLSETEFRTVSDLKHRVILVTDSLTRRRFQDSVGFEAPCCDDSIARDHLQPG